jgi:hypothetical protein
MRVTSAKKNGKAIAAWSRAWRHRKWLRTGFRSIMGVVTSLISHPNLHLIGLHCRYKLRYSGMKSAWTDQPC